MDTSIFKYMIKCIFFISCLGPEGKCPATCPVVCPPDHTTCPGGIDAAGCPMPDSCMPLTFGTDGNVCPATCPVPCPDGHMFCDGGVDANGCMMPNTCVPNDGRYIFLQA